MASLKRHICPVTFSCAFRHTRQSEIDLRPGAWARCYKPSWLRMVNKTAAITLKDRSYFPAARGNMATGNHIATYLVRPAVKKFQIGRHYRADCQWIFPLTDKNFPELTSRQDIEACYAACVEQIDTLMKAAFKRRGLFAHGIFHPEPFAENAFAVTIEEVSFKTERIEDWRDTVRRYNVFDDESAYTAYMICRGL